MESLYIRPYSDTSFESNIDGSSQIGFCVVLMDKYGKFSLQKYRSTKRHRIWHSAMAAEACAFAEAYDASLVLRHELEVISKRKVPLKMIIETKQVFDATSYPTRTKERRVMNDLAADKKGFENREITDFGLATAENMLADTLNTFTKIMKPNRLITTLSSGVINHQIVSWMTTSYYRIL